MTGLFDTHSFFNNMLDNPSEYLNGTAPLNTTGAVKSCVYQLNESTADPGACTIAQGSDRDSFIWYVFRYFGVPKWMLNVDGLLW